MLRTNELRRVPDMVIKIAMEWWQFVQSSPDESTQRAHCRAVLLDRHGSTPLRGSQGRGCRSNATDISMREGSVFRRGSRLSQWQQ